MGWFNRWAARIPWPVAAVAGGASMVLALMALAWPHLWILHGGLGPWWFFLFAALHPVAWASMMLQGLANIRRGRVAAAYILFGGVLWICAWLEWTLAGTATRWVLSLPLEAMSASGLVTDEQARAMAADWFLWPARVLAVLAFVFGRMFWISRKLYEVDLSMVRSETGAIRPGDVILGIDEETGEEILLRERDRTMHMLVLGPPGTGKTAGVLAPMAAQDLAQPSIGVTIIEPKGDWIHAFGGMPGAKEIALYYGRTVYVLDPTDPESDAFNPLAGPPDIVAAVNAAALEATQEGSEEYFRAMARTVYGNIIKLCKYLELRHPRKEEFGNPTYKMVGLALNDEEYLKYLLKELSHVVGARLIFPSAEEGGRSKPGPKLDLVGSVADQPVGRLLRWFVNEYLSPMTRDLYRQHSLGLRLYVEQLFQHEGFLRLFVPDGHRRVVDMDRHLEEASVLLVNTSRGEAPLLSRLLGTLVSLHLSYAVQRRKGIEFQKGRRKAPLHILYMDEFASYVNEEFAAFLEQARGYHFGAVLGTQSLADFEKVGRYFRAQMLGTIRNYVVYGGISVQDAKYFSDAFGTQTVIETNSAETRRYDQAGVAPGQSTVSISRREVERPRFSVRDLRELPSNTFVYQILSNRNLQPARRGKARMLSPDDFPGWDEHSSARKDEHSTSTGEERDENRASDDGAESAVSFPSRPAVSADDADGAADDRRDDDDEFIPLNVPAQPPQPPSEETPEPAPPLPSPPASTGAVPFIRADRKEA